MSSSLFGVRQSGTPDDGESSKAPDAAAAATPDYFPSSYQPNSDPVPLKPKFTDPPVASAAAAPQAPAVVAPVAPAPEPQQYFASSYEPPAPAESAAPAEPAAPAAQAYSSAPPPAGTMAPPQASAREFLASMPAPGSLPDLASAESLRPAYADMPAPEMPAPVQPQAIAPAQSRVAIESSAPATSRREAQARLQAEAAEAAQHQPAPVVSAGPAAEQAPAPQQAPVAQEAPVAPVSQQMPQAPLAAESISAEPVDLVSASPAPATPASATPTSATQEPAAVAAALEDLPGPQPLSMPEQSAQSEEPAMQNLTEAVPASSPFTSARSTELNPDPDLEAALQMVLMKSGSDLHISAGAPPMIRIDGALKPIDGAPVWSEEKATAALHSIMTPKQLEIFKEELEFDFAYTLSENARFRVNFYQQRNHLGAAFRLIPTEIKALTELGVPDSIASFAKLARGLVLVTGPTGSGKSTTLAAIMDLVNKTRTDHIMTVEDPIEFLHQNQKSLINQREVGHDTHSFAAALKHVLRQDPDVILVGELRDLETISVALTAAETGHLVFATLHTQDAPQTIDRIIDVYPPHQQGQVRAQLAATLQGVVCQTLIKRANGRGRVVATEVLMATSAVANLIREGKTYQINSSMQAGRDLGMHTMDQHLADLVNSGQISWDSAVEKAHDIEVLKRLVTRADTAVAVGANMASQGVNFADAYSGKF